MVQSPPTPHAVSAARTREALTDAALTLFARDGFDATTADRIAERAGVSPRTFFRYFPTKESVVFHRDYGFMRSFASAYVDSPASASDYEAVRATFVELAAGFGELRSRIETYRAAVDSSAVLDRPRAGAPGRPRGDRGRGGGASARSGRTRRRVRDPRRVALALYQRALRRWLDGPRARELADLIDEEFARLPRLVA